MVVIDPMVYACLEIMDCTDPYTIYKITRSDITPYSELIASI